MKMSGKIILLPAFLVIIIAFVGIAYAQGCPPEYNSGNITINGQQFCTDASGNALLTQDNVNNIGLLAGKNFKTEGPVNLPGGGTINGPGTVNADGTIKLGTGGTLTTSTGATATGDVTYNPNTGKISFGANGGSLNGQTFYNANDVVRETNGVITGVAGKGCILPNNLKLPEGREFKIEPDTKTGVSYITIEGCEGSCEVEIYGQMTSTDNQPFIFLKPTKVKTGGGNLEVTGGVMECTSKGNCYVPKGNEASINGVFIKASNNDVDIIATKDASFNPLPEHPHSVTFYNFDTEGQRKLSIVNNDKLNGIITGIYPGLFGVEKGDTLQPIVFDGMAILEERKETTPQLTLQGNAEVINDAHDLSILNGKILSGNMPLGENAVALHVVFNDANGNRLKAVNGDEFYVDYNNVNKGNENLFTISSGLAAAGGFWIDSFEMGHCPFSQTGAGKATAFIGNAITWITGKEASTVCTKDLSALKAKTVFSCSDINPLCKQINVRDLMRDATIMQIAYVYGEPCVISNQNGYMIKAWPIVTGYLKDGAPSGQLYYMTITTDVRGEIIGGRIFDTNNQYIGSITHDDVINFISRAPPDQQESLSVGSHPIVKYEDEAGSSKEFLKLPNGTLRNLNGSELSTTDYYYNLNKKYLKSPPGITPPTIPEPVIEAEARAATHVPKEKLPVCPRNVICTRVQTNGTWCWDEDTGGEVINCVPPSSQD